MDSWTLQGDSYSFMRSAPRTFSLCHREGTPNHVEIFDIINIPTQRSVISETTCLCDIFDNDGESASLSTSPAAAPSVLSQTEVEARAVASPQVDDLNDSSGSYHTAPGSSEGEEGFDDSRARCYSPDWQKECLDGRRLHERGLKPENTQVADDSISNFEQTNTTPVLLHNTSTPSSVTPSYQGLNSFDTTPSPDCNSPSSFNPEGRLSSLSSSSGEKRISPLSPGIKESHTITSSFKDRQSSPSIQSLSPSLPQDLFELGASELNQNSSSSTETHTHQDYTDTESRTIFSSPKPNGVDSKSSSERLSVSPELRNKSPSPTQTLSIFSQSRGRISVPDLFSRGFKTDIKYSANTTELISDLSIARTDTITAPESQDTGSSTGPGSSVSTPDPRYTPPSPVISVATSPELVEDIVSAEIRNTKTSPHLLTPTFQATSGSRSQSPIVQNNLTLSENRSQVSSPVVGNGSSFSPLPGVQQNSSPLKERYTSTSPETRIVSSSPKLSTKESQVTSSPGLHESSALLEKKYNSLSPEIRIVSSSPELRRKEKHPQVVPLLGQQEKTPPSEERYTSQSPEIGIVSHPSEVTEKGGSSQGKEVSESPLLEQQVSSATPRSFTPPPDITGVSDSVVQPEDRTRTTFPEFSHISPLELNKFIVSPESGVETSVAQSAGSQRKSSYLPDVQNSVPLSQLGNKIPSPQPYYLPPSAEPRYQTHSPDEIQSPSSQHQHSSPETQFPGERFQESSTALSTEHNPLYTKPVPLESTFEYQPDTITAGIIEIPSSSYLANKAVSPSFELERIEEKGATEVRSNQSVVDFCTPISGLSDKNSNNSDIQLITERDKTKKEENCQEKSSVAIITQEKHKTQTPFSQEEEINSPSHNITSDRAACTALSKKPVQKQEKHHPTVSSQFLNLDCDIYQQGWTCTPHNSRRQLVTKVIQDNRESLAVDMSHHVKKRSTPSPPLTRFTPIHIIAPQKPHRNWQNRSNSPCHVLASSLSGNLKEAVTNRENPSVDPVYNNRQAHWVKTGKQLEMDREIPLEQKSDVVMKSQVDREIDRERKGEEQAPEREEGWQGAASYRGEQVELSFNARNRKGPVSSSAAPTTRETRQGLPTAHSYSESLPATRQLQQQHSLLKLASQPDLSTSRRLKPPTSLHRRSVPRRIATNRPCQSSSSSMGSELDEADHEVKWLTDVAFQSLSSPEVDYLEMYNSSHCSSTNISQPSTHNSPAGVNAAWLSYADFRGSAPKLDLDELSSHQHYSDSLNCLDQSRRCELGSFECIDVAIEREDCRKIRRGVPKRQIQLKRKNNTGGKQDESSENSSPGVPVMMESPSQETHPRGTFIRQHSTPAAMQETPVTESSSELQRRQPKLQKSASMDETYCKTKNASYLIKSVLSKKMQGVDKQPDEQASEDMSQAKMSVTAPSEESPKLDSSNLSSSFQSDHSLSSEGPSLREEPSKKDETYLPKDHGLKSSYRPSSSSSCRSVTFSQTDSEEANSQTRSNKSSASENKSKLSMPFESTRSGFQSWKTHESMEDESVKAHAWDTEAHSAQAASNIIARGTKRDKEFENKDQDRTLLQAEKDKYIPNTKEITLKAVEKKKASLNVCVTPEADSKYFLPDASAGENEENAKIKTKVKTDDEGNGDDRVKAPIHKVRDVRRLVKNTFNLSFKAVSPVNPADVNKENCNNETTEDITVEEKINVLPEVNRGKSKKETEQCNMDKTSEQKEEATDSMTAGLLNSAQNKTNSPSGPQPMQIECKAVCWKDDKNKISNIKKDLGDKPQGFLLPSQDANSRASTLKQTVEEKMIKRLGECDISTSAEKKKNVTQILKVPDSEDKPTLARTDRKPPMLGSLPKLPSKEREVSTAVVLIRERSNKSNMSASLSQEETSAQMKAPVTLSLGPSASGGTAGGSGGHSVSMLLKGKGYQADIGAVVSDGQLSTAAKRVPCKHVNSLEIPLQTVSPSERGFSECHRGRTFSSSSTTSGPSAISEGVELLEKPIEQEGVGNKPQKKDKETTERDAEEQTLVPIEQNDAIGDFEAVKRTDPTFPPRSPAIRRFKPQPGETRSPSNETEIKEIPSLSLGSHKPQTIEVKSIAKNSQKPVVPPKPNCKFKPGDLENVANNTQITSAALSTGKQRNERSQTIVVSSPTIYRKIPSESFSASNYSRKLAVSAVSSLKPPPHKTTAATVTSISNMSTASSDTEATSDQGQHQQSTASPQSSRHAQKPGTLTTTSDSGLGVSPQLVSEPNPNQNVGSNLSETNQSTSVDQGSQLQYSRTTTAHEQTMPVTSNNRKQIPAASTTQRYTQPYSRTVSREDAQRIDEQHFYVSDDPPSYDERESFSPLLLPDMTSLRSNRYQSSSHPSCSCTAGYSSHCGPSSPHQHRSPHNLTPPGAPHSPGSALPYQVVSHQCRPELQPIGYQTRSSKSSPLGPNQPPSMYPPLHHSVACPPHPSLMQAYPAERIGPRRPPVHRSPHQQPPSLTGATYSDTGHSHSPGLPPIDTQYLCGPQSMGPSYGSEYGGDNSSVYSETSYTQPPRRVLLDPETGKYFYIEVPVQPLRKMLFDPETGQYVEVLIPQQAMSHSGLYPPTGAPFQPLPNPNIYASAPQYIPCAAPPLAHPQVQPQPPQYPEASPAPTMHPSGPGVSYRNPSGQGSKPEPKNHPPLDQRYLENMYYVPSVINSSPNTSPPDYYHRHPSNLPPTGGKRS